LVPPRRSERRRVKEEFAIEPRRVGDLRPYPGNPRKITQAAIDKVAASLKEYGWRQPIVVDEKNEIIVGHTRYAAAKQLGVETVPVHVARGLTPDQIRAYRIADNRAGEESKWDLPALGLELQSLSAVSFDLGLTGFGIQELSDLNVPGFADPNAADDLGETYSRKIAAPIYTPTGDAPAAAELYDDAKTLKLQKKIRAADLPDEIAEFLNKAAERHTVFDFHRIADFYANAPAATQRLMEESALVIIDFDQAIENGFVRLTQRLGALASEHHPED
jgi:hypothetical protein